MAKAERRADRITTRIGASGVIAAYVLDRAEQYNHGSGIYIALLAIADGIRRGEAWNAYDHGELDDLLKGVPRG